MIASDVDKKVLKEKQNKQTQNRTKLNLVS